jgi:hypothetical protein
VRAVSEASSCCDDEGIGRELAKGRAKTLHHRRR